MIKVTMSCEEISPKYKEFAIETTHNAINEALTRAQNESPIEQIKIFDSISTEVNRYSTNELRHHWFNKNSQFQDWCDDVGLYYVYRLVLFDEAIPIVM